jgi:hypothetical protein
MYKRVIEQAGPSSEYGQRAQSRINEAESAPAANTAPPPKPTATASPPKAAEPVDTADLPQRSRSDIDTTDLPGVKAP